MKRSLISQMCNEWRSNIWMILELTIVSLILWYLFTSIWALLSFSLSYKGYDVSDDLYFANIHAIDENSSYFQPYDSTHSYQTDCEMLMSKLRANPNTEVVGGGVNILSYCWNYYGQHLSHDSLTYYGNMRMVTPDVIRAYRLESLDGKSTEQLAEIISRGELIISEPDLRTEEYYNNPKPFVMKDVIIDDDSAVVRRVGAIACGIRRTDYEPQRGVIYSPLPDGRMASDVIIRTLPGLGREFMESLGVDDKRAGNIYLSNLRSVAEARNVAQLRDSITIRNFVICAVFLLLVVFLGFLGTFWFRTQQRVEEIAIRIVNGAARRDIFRRFIGEGLLLLCLATLITLPVELVLIHYGVISNLLYTYNEMTLRSPEIYVAMGLSIALLMLLIIAGIIFPARKAMNINPAYALKDQ